MRRWPVLVTLLLLALPWRGEAANDAGRVETDWAATIIQLRAQLDRQPHHKSTRRQLAIAYNNYGVGLAEAGRVPDAIHQLEEALRLDPSNTQLSVNLATIHVQLAQAAFTQRDGASAKSALDRALQLNPKDAHAYTFLGDLAYFSQHLKEARTAWEAALAINPDLMDVRTKLSQLTQELPVESKFEKLSQIYFDIRYTEELDRPAGFDIRDSLLAARRSIGSDFAYWPKHKLIVLIYNDEQWRQLRQDVPEWVGGQFDGKIRVPLPGRTLDRAAVTRILYHEYTHALVEDLTAGRCPKWFNEGLAEHEAWKDAQAPWLALRQLLVARQAFIPWPELSQYISPTRPAQEVSIAYQQSHSIVSYLIQRYGLWRIRRLLAAVKNGIPLEDAMTKELHTKLERLEREWRKWLEAQLGVPAS